MKTISSESTQQYKRLIQRALVAYLGAAGIVALALIISITHGAGWRPALAGMPLYVIVFAGITYQLIKEIVKLRKQERERQASAEIKEH
jgi:NhaP-type Na+/H+ or K+/H+ antiporter